MAADLTALDTIVDRVLDCVCSSLTQAFEDEVPGATGCPCRSCKIAAGPQVEFVCEPAPSGAECAGGSLSVRVLRLYPSSTFPAQDSSSAACEPRTIVAELSVLLLRCMPIAGDDDDLCPPTCEQWAEVARTQHVDMMTLYNAASCCVPPALVPADRKPRRVVIGSHTAVGPDFGCVGSDLRLLVDVGSSCSCADNLPTPDPSA